MPFDAYAEFEGCPGESLDKDHVGWCNVANIAHSIVMPAATAGARGGQAGGRATHEPFTVNLEVDKAFPKLVLNCSMGTHIPKVTVNFCEQTGQKQTYLQLVLEKCILSQVNLEGHPDGGVRPTVHVAMHYDTITWTYTEIDEEGSAKGNVEAKYSPATGEGE